MNSFNGNKFFLQRELFSNKISVSMARVDVNGHAGYLSIATPAVFKTVPEGELIACSEPLLRLSTEEAQQLMDELWNCGLRPSEGTGSAGSLRATENHLADMRKIAFDLLGKVN